jgi:hypothetical protein
MTNLMDIQGYKAVISYDPDIAFSEIDSSRSSNTAC